MRVVAINRFFRPDHGATSRLPTAVSRHPARRVRAVTVIAGRRRCDGRGTEGRPVGGAAVPVVAFGGEPRRKLVCRPRRAKASSSALRQKLTSIVFESRQLRTTRLAQSMITTR